jgi:hypothetical protein
VTLLRGFCPLRSPLPRAHESGDQNHQPGRKCAIDMKGAFFGSENRHLRRFCLSPPLPHPWVDGRWYRKRAMLSYRSCLRPQTVLRAMSADLARVDSTHQCELLRPMKPTRATRPVRSIQFLCEPTAQDLKNAARVDESLADQRRLPLDRPHGAGRHHLEIRQVGRRPQIVENFRQQARITLTAWEMQPVPRGIAVEFSHCRTSHRGVGLRAPALPACPFVRRQPRCNRPFQRRRLSRELRQVRRAWPLSR